MRKSTVAALTAAEITNIVTSSVKLLFEIEKVDEDRTLVAYLKRLLSQVFEQLPEHYFERIIEASVRGYNDRIKVCLAYKEVSDCRYFSDGRLIFSYGSVILMPPWEPKNKRIVKLIKDNTKKFKLQFEQKDSLTAEDTAQREIAMEDRMFWNELNKVKNAYMRYQMYKFLDKQYKPSKKFLINGKPLWQFVDILREVIKTTKNVSMLKSSTEKATAIMKSLFQNFGSNLVIRTFNSLDDISSAYRNRLMYEPRDNSRSVANRQYWETHILEVKDDPDIQGHVYYSQERYLTSWCYSLQELADNGTLESDLVDFLRINGFIKAKGD